MVPVGGEDNLQVPPFRATTSKETHTTRFPSQDHEVMQPSSLLVSLVLVAALSCVHALPPIVVRGNYMYNSATGERFVMRGITYEYDVSNDNYEKNSKDAIARAVKDFDGTLNTLRIYQVNPEKNYSAFMQHMEEEKIYVMIAASPGTQDYFGSYRWSPIAKASPPWGNPTCYPSYLLHYGKRIAAMFSAYNHTLGLIMANEVMQASLIAAPCVKQYVADLKNWMRTKHDRMRLLPLAYAAADGAYIGEKGEEKPAVPVDANEYAVAKIQGLLCGDTMVNGQMMSSIDIYLINEYRWCPGSKYENTYAYLQRMAAGVPIVMALGEYGCDKSPPRDFAMIPYLFGDSTKSQGFSDVFSGGFVYSFGEANLGKDTFFPLFIGGDTSITGKPGTTATPAYANLLKQFKANPPFTSYEKATWSAENATDRCTWAPTVLSKIDASNKRATAAGWIPKDCANVKIIPSNWWWMDSREGMGCWGDGSPCNVEVKKDDATLSQKAFCGGWSPVVKECAKDDECGKNGGKCSPDNKCICTGCMTGPGCKIAINDDLICNTKTGAPTPPTRDAGPSPAVGAKSSAATTVLAAATVLALALFV
ncbi:Aste57867_14764 [Aphanomyces stellatus]|uniref:Aste57867_14764 protein n=1 Tax=Aphanomyces stellatus TaxID=120398 RepID=A0A485L1I5_9STRA|nr:hypothetical protein As57867_014709 [Aphanomyces stellatus]VFT91582.1 Aste57867_14764 [Aphanomyces stellatus]